MAKKSVAKKVTDSILSDIKNANIFKIIISSFRAWYRNWPWMILSVLVDLIFIGVLSVASFLISLKLFEHIEAMLNITGEITGGIMNVFTQPTEVSTGIASLSQNTQLQSHTQSMLNYLGLLVLASFLCWIVFQGISWYIAYRMSTRKNRQSFIVYWKNFALESIPFHVLTSLWIFLTVWLMVKIRMSLVKVVGDQFSSILFMILILITWYFGTLCYSITTNYAYRNFKQAFIYGIKRFTKTIQSYIFIFILYIVLDLLFLIGFMRENVLLAGIILIMPAIVFARILLFKTRQAYWPLEQKKKKA